jgi:hypothetical protein
MYKTERNCRAFKTTLPHCHIANDCASVGRLCTSFPIRTIISYSLSSLLLMVVQLTFVMSFLISVIHPPICHSLTFCYFSDWNFCHFHLLLGNPPLLCRQSGKHLRTCPMNLHFEYRYLLVHFITWVSPITLCWIA